MSCVLGMIVRREREIRDFVKTPFFRMIGDFRIEDKTFSAEWKAVEGSKYFNTPHLYKENGLKEKSEAEKFCEELAPERPATVTNLEKKKERKNAPLLFNLAELQNICSKLFKISPDQTLQITQELYEKKMVTYPRTDARVLRSEERRVGKEC